MHHVYAHFGQSRRQIIHLRFRHVFQPPPLAARHGDTPEPHWLARLLEHEVVALGDDKTFGTGFALVERAQVQHRFAQGILAGCEGKETFVGLAAALSRSKQTAGVDGLGRRDFRSGCRVATGNCQDAGKDAETLDRLPGRCRRSFRRRLARIAVGVRRIMVRVPPYNFWTSTFLPPSTILT